jgi:hypothetical protein
MYPIDGFSGRGAARLFGDSVQHPVKWPKQRSWGELADRAHMLRGIRPIAHEGESPVWCYAGQPTAIMKTFLASLIFMAGAVGR